MRYRSLTAMSASVLLAASSLAIASTSSAEPQHAEPEHATYSGSFALSGEEARSYTLPEGMEEVWSSDLPGGRTQTRYQQMVGDAQVFGGQITIIEDAAGQPEAVIGAQFPALRPSNERKLGKAKARDVAEKRIGRGGTWSTELHIDPRTGRLFYEVESIRHASRPIRWVNAANGKVIKSFDALAHGDGIGVKGDVKDPLLTSLNPGTGLYELASADGRQITYTAGNGTGPTVSLMTDADDHWDTNSRNLMGDSQAPGVDAQYYANVVDDFYGDVFGRNSIDDQGLQIVSVVHWDRNYCNASWNGQYMVYGDGDGRGCLPLSGGLDVDGHELTHGVTDYTSDLIYEQESGALNEAFSDMMGNTIEFYAEDHGLDPAGSPDFRIGEDVINPDTPESAGFRNMAEPGEFGDPDHVVDKYTGTLDGGGVHTNSGIPNHVYYLAVNGGQNRGCVEPVVTHTEDCDVNVPAIGVDAAAQIFYAGFTSLPEYANFCDARNATVAVAGDSAGAVSAAWDAVGVHGGCSGGTPPPAPCQSDADAAIPFESPHPYGNLGDCTWTYDNGSAGFAFHFSMLQTEAGYDYVYVKDANGNVVATYTGAAVKGKRGLTTPCIPTSVGSVQLVTDPAVTAPGFIVDAVVDC
jgi:bacillolysin